MNQSVIIPIGSHEQHGQHLPPNTDYLIARAIAEEIKKQINMEIDMGISVSYSPEHLDFEETKSISKEEFINQINERLSLYDKKKIRIIINAHGGNSQILENLKKKNQISFTLFNIFKVVKKHLTQLRSSRIGGICHAGEFETSLMLYLFPSKVKLERITQDHCKYVPELDPCYEGLRPKKWKTIDLNPHGILGDPLKATREKGKKWCELIINDILNSITKLSC